MIIQDEMFSPHCQAHLLRFSLALRAALVRLKSAQYELSKLGYQSQDGARLDWFEKIHKQVCASLLASEVTLNNACSIAEKYSAPLVRSILDEDEKEVSADTDISPEFSENQQNESLAKKATPVTG